MGAKMVGNFKYRGIVGGKSQIMQSWYWAFKMSFLIYGPFGPKSTPLGLK